MIDIKNFATTEMLKSGITVTIRAVRPDDKDLLVEAFAKLEPETIYTRFFHHKTSLTEAELAMLTHLDFAKGDVGLVATYARPDKESIIGAARYALLPTGQGRPSAEVAFIVEEDFQGLGLASRLLSHLIGIAREQGIANFEAVVLAGNTAMLTVFKRAGLSLQMQHEDGEVHVIMSL